MGLAKLKGLLTEPDGFTGDPWGFARNQAGHAVLGAGAALLVGPFLAVSVYAVWEYAQWQWFAAEAWDSSEDMGFFATGALAAATSPWVLGVTLLFLAAGILRRIKERPHADRDPD